MSNLSAEMPLIWIAQQVARLSGEPYRDVLISSEWLEQVRQEAGGGYLTTKNPVLITAIEREVERRREMFTHTVKNG